MRSEHFIISKFHAVRKKYNKLKSRYLKNSLNKQTSTSSEILIKLKKYEKQLANLALTLQRMAKKGMIAGSLALAFTFSACDDDNDPAPGVDFKDIALAVNTTDNPVGSFDVGNNSTPVFVDIDGDGDFDMFVGENAGFINYYKNTGSSTAPAFSEQTGSNNPFNGLDAGTNSRIAFGDIDGDGDFDAIVTNRNNTQTILYYKNTGDKSSPTFTSQTGNDNIFSSLIGYDNYDHDPVLVDIDNDGDLDLFFAEEGYDIVNGPTFTYSEAFDRIRYVKNTGSRTAPAFTEQSGSSNPANNISVGNDPKVHFADLDGDGDFDMVVNHYNSPDVIKVYENTGSKGSPAFTEVTGTDNPLNGISVYSAFPTTVDIDNDGDLDLFFGQGNGTISFYKNTTGE